MRNTDRDPAGTLFPLSRLSSPTTRDVARLVKAGGSAALDEAQRRADEARYQEVTCRSALNPTEGMPFRWTLNPYRGCTHACHYCFARRYHTQFELDADDDFSTLILVKVNLVEQLTRELARASWTRELVALGTATDPYQPIEGTYRLTRGALEALANARTPVGLVTKGPMVVRDIDVLQAVDRAAGCTVYVSVPSIGEDAWRRLEPGTAHPLQRLRAVRALNEAGLRAGVLMAPLVPGIATHPQLLADTMQAIADHGAAFVGADVLRLQGATRDHFLAFLQREYPGLVRGYGDLYANGAARARPDYLTQLRAVVDLVQKRAGLERRPPHEALAGKTPGDTGDPPEREQAAFAWQAEVDER